MPSVAGLLYGLKPAVVAIVAEAVLRIGKKAIKNWFFAAIAALSFIAITAFSLPFPVVVLSAAGIGFIARHYMPHLFGSAVQKQDVSATLISSLAAGMPGTNDWRPALSTAALWLSIWAAPLAAVWLWKGESTFTDLGLLFSKAAMVTFGGAYAVLAYVGQEAVQHGWLRSEQMMDGLALAETTPGPLIMVNQFVGYTAAYLNPGDLSPAAAGVIGGLLTTWVTFAQSFLMIFLFAPYIEILRKNTLLSPALAAVTAAVVGVVLNLAVTFTRHALLPDKVALDLYALIASVVTFYGLQYCHWPMIPVIISSALAGFIWKYAIGI